VANTIGVSVYSHRQPNDRQLSRGPHATLGHDETSAGLSSPSNQFLEPFLAREAGLDTEDTGNPGHIGYPVLDWTSPGLELEEEKNKSVH